MKLTTQKTVRQKTKKPRYTPVKPLVENYGIPPGYNTTSLTLIYRDPYWIFAYWEITQDSLNQARIILGDIFEKCACVLRFYEVSYIDFNGNNANHWFDVVINPMAGNWYVNLWNDNCTYCADLGLRAPDGKFTPLARSNFVSTPRASCAQRRDVMYMEVTDTQETPQIILGPAQSATPVNSVQACVTIEPQTQKKNLVNPISSAPAKKAQQAKLLVKPLVTEEDVIRYYEKFFVLIGNSVKECPLTREELAKNIFTRDCIPTLDEILSQNIPWREWIMKNFPASSAEFLNEHK